MMVFNRPICIGIIAAIFFPYAVKSNENYCQYGDDHLLCNPQKISDNCVAHREIPVTCEMKKMIVDAHNDARNGVANGTALGLHNKTFSQASNMREISWSNILALAAQKMTNRCNLTTSSTVQQLIFPFFKEIPFLQDLMFINENIEKYPYITWKAWMNYLNVLKLSFDTTSLKKLDDGDRNFAQIIWAKTYLIGCASTSFWWNSTNVFVASYVCLYGPAGLINNQLIYYPGAPCTKCPYNGTCSSIYKGLCSSFYFPRPSTSDEYTPNIASVPLTKGEFWYLFVAFGSVFLAVLIW